MTFEVTNDREDEKTPPPLLGKDHQRGDQEEIMAGSQTKTNKVYEEGQCDEGDDTLVPGQDLDLGIKSGQETLPKSQDSVELAGGKNKDREQVLKCEEGDRGDGEEATEGESSLTERSPEAHNSHTEATQPLEPDAHTDLIGSALEDGETTKEAVTHALGEQFLLLSENDLPIADCELGQLASLSPTKDKSEQERPDEVLDPGMTLRET